MKKKKKNDLDQIEMEIDDTQNKASDEDEDIIVPPKVEIFKDNSKPQENGVGYTATFHGTDNEDSDENVKIDETYKSSVQADHQFMITFGLSSNQPQSV